MAQTEITHYLSHLTRPDMQSVLNLIVVGTVFAVSCSALSSPPSGAVTIGSSGTYSTISAALADTSATTYFIYAVRSLV